MRIGNFFHPSYWLDPSVLVERAGSAMWLAVAFGALWCLAGAALAIRRRAPQDVALAQVLGGLLIGAVAAGRLYAVPVLGLRIGWLIAAAVMAAPLAPRIVRQAMRDGLPQDCLRATAFGVQEPHRWSVTTILAWVGLYLAASMAVLSIIKQPVWYAPILIALLLAPPLITFFLRPRSNRNLQSPISNLTFASLAPLLVVYAVLGLRLLVSLIARVTIGQFRVVEPFGSLLDLPLSLVVMSAYAFIAAIYQATANCQSQASNLESLETRSLFVRIGSIALVAGVVAWAIWNALTLHTQGISGSDPYAYVQMGVDLAEHGTVFHSFPLIRLTYALNIPSEPVVHVGYRLPQDVQRTATTVWPPGYAVFTALAYLLGGEQGVYLVTPLLSLISLGVVGALGYKIARDASLGNGANAVAALAVFLTATSYQQVEWQLIPMADIAAQLFSLLALYAALRVNSGRASWVAAAIGGLAMGAAFDIRYTQVLIAPALAFAVVTAGSRQPRALVQRVGLLAICGIAALAAAMPTFVYHTLAFGNPLLTGSEELANFSLARLPETLSRIAGELLSMREFGLLLPLILVGIGVLWRWARRSFWTLAIYFVPLFAFHIAYAYLRPRDILFLFPVLGILAAIGAVWLVSVVLRASPRPRIEIIRAVVLVALSFGFIVRGQHTLELPITHGFAVFGYMVREQRASFTRLAQLTPANAVIGSSLNSGAVDLHAGRLSFRPATWTPEQTLTFVNALRAEGVPVYMLEDGDEVRPALSALRTRYHLAEIARLDMPYYFHGSGSENRKVAVYRVDD